MNRYTQNGTTLHDANEVRYGGMVRGYGGTVRWYAGTLKTARPYTTLMRYSTVVHYEGTVVRYGGTLVHSKRHDANEVRYGGTVRGYGGTVGWYGPRYGGTVRAYGGTVAWWYGGTVACRWLSWRCCLLSCVNIGQQVRTLYSEPGLSNRKDKYCLSGLSHGFVWYHGLKDPCYLLHLVACD